MKLTINVTALIVSNSLVVNFQFIKNRTIVH